MDKLKLLQMLADNVYSLESTVEIAKVDDENRDMYTVTVDGEQEYNDSFENIKRSLADRMEEKEIESMLDAGKSDEEIINEISGEDVGLEVNLRDITEDSTIKMKEHVSELLKEHFPDLNDEKFEEFFQRVMNKIAEHITDGDIKSKIKDAVNEIKASTRHKQLEELEEHLSTELLLRSIVDALSDEQFYEVYKYIKRMNDIDVSE